MADDQVATRAPESDLAEADPKPVEPASNNASTNLPKIPGDTPITETGPASSMAASEHCTSDRPTPASSAQPAGELTTLNDIACYVTKPASYPQEPGKLLLLLTGGTGLHSVNNQLQADAYAARGFLVVMPDQFGGDAAPNVGVLSDEELTAQAHSEAQADDAPERPGLLERIRKGAAEAAKAFLIDMWLARHTPEKVLPVVSAALDGARESYADAVANGGGVYGVGYCFGAKYILLLCGGDEGAEPASAEAEGQSSSDDGPPQPSAAKRPRLKAGAIAHGTLVTKEDIETVRAPVSMVCVADDNLFPDEVREQGRASLELNAVEHDVRVFGGVPHGFAVVGDYADAEIRERQVEAFELMCSWLEGH